MLHACCDQTLSINLCVIEIQTHGLPPEEPGREEDRPGALK